MNSEFYNLIGGFYFWLFIKFCQTKLSEEQDNKYRSRNLFTAFLINLLIIILICFIFIKF